MNPKYTLVQAKLDAIENEMKRIGLWQAQPLSKAQYDFHQAFAMDTMTFSQWLQFIFIPRVRSIIESEGQFPNSSSVGVMAVREFDGLDKAAQLTSMLSEFDALFA